MLPWRSCEFDVQKPGPTQATVAKLTRPTRTKYGSFPVAVGLQAPHCTPRALGEAPHLDLSSPTEETWPKLTWILNFSSFAGQSPCIWMHAHIDPFPVPAETEDRIEPRHETILISLFGLCSSTRMQLGSRVLPRSEHLRSTPFAGVSRFFRLAFSDTTTLAPAAINTHPHYCT